MIIGFCYKACSGKSVSAKYLENTYSFLEDSFAFSLKQGVGKQVFGLTDDQLNYTKEIPDDFWGMSPRQILQLAGTDALRKVFGKSIWVKTLERRILAHPTRNYAISDVRFKNEAEAIKKWGGKVIRIDRKGSGTSSVHVSETELDSFTGWDEIVDNNGDFNHLYAQLDQIVSKYVLKESKPVRKKKIKKVVVNEKN